MAINDIINLTRALNIFVFYDNLFLNFGKICEIISIKGFSFDKYCMMIYKRVIYEMSFCGICLQDILKR